MDQMSTKEIIQPEILSDDDMSMMLFAAQMAQNDELVEKLAHIINCVDEARDRGLKVTLYQLDGEVTYSVRKRNKIGFLCEKD